MNMANQIAGSALEDAEREAAAAVVREAMEGAIKEEMSRLAEDMQRGETKMANEIEKYTKDGEWTPTQAEQFEQAMRDTGGDMEKMRERGFITPGDPPTICTGDCVAGIPPDFGASGDAIGRGATPAVTPYLEKTGDAAGVSH